MSQKKQGVLLGYLSIALNNGIQVLLIPFIISCIGQAEYGLYTIVGSFLAALIIMDMGLSSSVIRFLAKYRANKDKKSEENFIAISLILYLIIAIITFIIGLILKEQLPYIFRNSLNENEILKVQSMFFVLFINIAFSLSINSFKGIITAYESFVFIRYSEIFRVIIRTLLVIIVLSRGHSALGIIVVDTVCNIGISLIMVIYALWGLKIKIKLHTFSAAILKEIFSFSIFIFLNVLAGELYWRISVVIVGSLINPSLTSVYSIGSQISTYLIIFSSNIAYVIGPGIILLIERKASERVLTDIFIKIGRLQSFVLYLICTNFIFFGKKFINLWLGKNFEPAYYIALIIMVPLLFVLAQNTGIKILEAKCKHWFRSVIMFGMSFVNILLTYFLVKKYGIIGGAISTSICLLVGNLVVLNVYYHKSIKIDMIRYYKEANITIIGVTLLSCALGFLISKDQNVSWFSFSYQVLSYSLIFVALQYFFAMNLYERNLIKKILKKVNFTCRHRGTYGT